MNTDTKNTRVTLATALRPGAVAVLQLHGQGTPDVLTILTGRSSWEPGRVYLADFAEIDKGLAVLIRSGDNAIAQLMPHGGPRVVTAILERLTGLGVGIENDPAPRVLFPEADSPIQADALAAIARAASPAAIDLLLAQPERWRQAIQQPDTMDRQRVLADSAILDRLINPPTVVVVGKPNVGKSTLTNRLLGRAVSLVADLPGTTRDWVGAMVEVGGLHGAVALRWLDTPGLHASDDQVEQRAITLARDMIRSADVLIAMRDPERDWPDAAELPREPDLRVVNKIDRESEVNARPEAVSISARTGRGIEVLQQRITQTLGLGNTSPDSLWAFSKTLQRYVRNELQELDGYL